MTDAGNGQRRRSRSSFESNLTKVNPWPVWRLCRDITTFIGGLAGVIHETFLVDTAEPALLFLFAAMMGLPGALAWFREKNGDGKS